MKRATNLQWRPYGNISTVEAILCGFSYRIGQRKDGQESDLRAVDQVLIGSDAYKARDSVVMNLLVAVQIWNSGKTPLWLRSRFTRAVFSGQWMDEYGKDPSRFIGKIKTWPEYDTLFTDIVIMPGDTFSPDIDTIVRTMSAQEFEAYRDSSHQLVVYPYTFIQYRDYRDQVFNAIRIEHIILNIDTADGTCHVKFVKKGDELYRWDVPD